MKTRLAPPEDFPLTYYDLAKRLGVMYSAVARLHKLHRDEIPGELIGNRWHFPVAAVEAMRRVLADSRPGRKRKPDAISVWGEAGQIGYHRLQQSSRDHGRITHGDVVGGAVSSEGATADLEPGGQKVRFFSALVTYLDATGKSQEDRVPVHAHDYTTASRLVKAYALQVLKLDDFEMRIVGAEGPSLTQLK